MDPILEKYPVIGWIAAVDRAEAAGAIVRLNMDQPMALYAFRYHFHVPAGDVKPDTTDAEYALLWANGMSFKDILKRMRAEASRGQS